MKPPSVRVVSLRKEPTSGTKVSGETSKTRYILSDHRIKPAGVNDQEPIRAIRSNSDGIIGSCDG